MKTKQAGETCKQFADILSTVNVKPMTLSTDKGGELQKDLNSLFLSSPPYRQTKEVS